MPAPPASEAPVPTAPVMVTPSKATWDDETNLSAPLLEPRAVVSCGPHTRVCRDPTGGSCPKPRGCGLALGFSRAPQGASNAQPKLSPLTSLEVPRTP